MCIRDRCWVCLGSDDCPSWKDPKYSSDKIDYLEAIEWELRKENEIITGNFDYQGDDIWHHYVCIYDQDIEDKEYRETIEKWVEGCLIDAQAEKRGKYT